MKIHSVYDDLFRQYGTVLADYDTAPLLAAMHAIPMPDKGVQYQPSIATLEQCAIFASLEQRAFGGMPIQLGMCWGYNSRLTCLEYHRSSEINIPAAPAILLLAKREQLCEGKLDVHNVVAFRVPAGCGVELYASTLHYAPCHTDAAQGFRVAIVLPRGTNTDYSLPQPASGEDAWLTARNKWLLAHPSSDEAAQGAHVGLAGELLDISND